MNDEHLNQFIICAQNRDYNWQGNNLADYLQYVKERVNEGFIGAIDRFPGQVTREELIDTCANNEFSLLEKCLMVLAWGGKRRPHAVGFANQFIQFQIEIDQFTDVNLTQTRSAAYRIFYHLRQQGLLYGVRPPFYTKFIFAIRPDLNGYIMDQYTGLSYNLIAEPNNPLNTDYNGRNINDNNTPEQYEQFCKFIEDLTVILNNHYPNLEEPYTNAETESLLFGNDCWRDYLNGFFGGNNNGPDGILEVDPTNPKFPSPNEIRSQSTKQYSPKIPKASKKDRSELRDLAWSKYNDQGIRPQAEAIRQAAEELDILLPDSYWRYPGSHFNRWRNQLNQQQNH